MRFHAVAAARRIDGCDRPVELNGRKRSSAAAATLRRLRPHFAELGITRLGEITQLDEAAIPVAFACRPNSFSLSLSLGKGLTRSLALTAAAMEAAEVAVAEREPPTLATASAMSLSEGGHALVDLARIARCWPHLADPATTIRWLTGVDLMSGADVLVPWDLVKLDHRVEPGDEIGAFEISSDGLASANTAAEATLHALYELIERDALALFELGYRPEKQPLAHVVHNSGNHYLNTLLENLRRAGHTLYLVDIATDIDLPVWLAIISDSHRTDLSPASEALHFIGCACHASDRRAAVSAGLEAVQARCAYIAGARDDFVPAEARSSGPGQPASPLSELIRRADDKPLLRVWKSSPPAATIGEQINRLLDRLKAIGVKQVIVVVLPSEPLGISVVRVIATDLQIPLHGQRTQLLGRGLRQVIKDAQ